MNLEELKALREQLNNGMLYGCHESGCDKRFFQPLLLQLIEQLEWREKVKEQVERMQKEASEAANPMAALTFGIVVKLLDQ